LLKENVFRMVKKIRKESSLGLMGDKIGCCKVESIINIDGRGQMVLPKELREKANIRPGDKLALICLEKKGTIYCLSLVRVEELTGMVKDLLGPMMKGDDQKSLSHSNQNSHSGKSKEE
jgi:AbrB family looped-hinge helix DNA binding protein